MLTHRCPWCGEEIKRNIFEPWDLISRLANSEEKTTCTHCKNRYKIASDKNIILFFLIAIMGLELIQSIVYSKNNSLFFGFIIVLLCVVALIYLFRIPYTRRNEIKTKDRSHTLDIFLFFIVLIIIANINLHKRFIIYCGIYILIILSIIVNFYLGKRKRVEKESNNIAKENINVSIVWHNHKNQGLVLPKYRIMDGEIFPVCFMDKKQIPISEALCVSLNNLKWKDTHHCICDIQLVLDNVSEKNLFIKDNKIFLYHNYRKIAEGIIL